MVELVGALNVTPDSFSDGGKFYDPKRAIAQAEQMFKDGASIVDIGAESTRPGAEPLSEAEEWRRLEPVLKELIPKHPGKISLDSFHPDTFKKAFDIGPVIVNDVTGMNRPEMVELVTILKPTVIISHLPGSDIQKAHQTEPITSVNQVKNDLLAKEALLISKGLAKDQIILDPGIGFGKIRSVNRELLEFAKLLPGHKVMIGYSRKRFLGEHRMELEPNLEAGRKAKAAGAAYLRVHDVAAHAQLLG